MKERKKMEEVTECNKKLRKREEERKRERERERGRERDGIRQN